MPLKSEIRSPKAGENPKAETRRPKEGRNPKPEYRSSGQVAERAANRSRLVRISDFGFRPSFYGPPPGVRTSGFGLRPVPSPGFSLIEIMVTVGLLSFIILGLLVMFNQTQRAFRT